MYKQAVTRATKTKQPASSQRTHPLPRHLDEILLSAHADVIHGRQPKGSADALAMLRQLPCKNQKHNTKQCVQDTNESKANHGCCCCCCAVYSFRSLNSLHTRVHRPLRVAILSCSGAFVGKSASQPTSRSTLLLSMAASLFMSSTCSSPAS